MTILFVLTSFRPFNRLETENGSTECIDVLDEHTVRMKNGGAVNGPEGDGKLENSMRCCLATPRESADGKMSLFDVVGDRVHL